MEEILFGLKGVEMSIDDVIIHTNSLEESIDRIRAVFERCCHLQFEVNFRQMSVWFNLNPVLGHVTTALGIKPDPCSENRSYTSGSNSNKRFRIKIVFWHV